MANHMHWAALLLSAFVACICDCKPIDSYKFPVYTTESCPRNQTEWSERSSAINCTESNGYLCLPNEDLTELLEFCYFDYQIPIAKGLCMFLRKRDSFIDDYSCRNFVEGCPNSTYRIYEAYKYRSCVSIGNGCFLDDPTCVRTIATYKVTLSSRTTAAVESQEKTKHERNDWVWIITLLGVFVLVFIPFVMYRIKIKEKHSKMSSNKITAVQVLEESDLEETEPMSKNSILMTKNAIEKMKTNTFKSLEKNLYILSDINGHFNEEGFFDEDFVQAAFDLERHSSALDDASLEISHQFEIELGDMFVQFSGVKTACDVVVFCLNKGYCDEKNELIDGVSNPLNDCMITLLNFTDVNARHCHLLVEHGEFLPQILKALQRLTSSHLKDNMQGNDEKVLYCYISIIHNIAQNQNSNPELRKIGFIEVLLPYLKSRSDRILLVTLTTLADLVADSEAEHVEANRDLVQSLLKCLTYSLNDRHRRYEGWSAMELIRTIRRIAKNDVNKKSLVAEGSLPVLVALSQSEHEDEQKEAFGALLVLSFDKDNQDIMLQDDAVMETLIKFQTSQNKKIKNACNGALWNMREKLIANPKYEDIDL